SRTSCGTVDERQIPSTSPRSRKLPIRAPSSSPVRCASVAIRQCSDSSVPSNSPNMVWVLPTSTASSTARAYRGVVRRLRLVVRAERFADALGQGLGGQRRPLALAPQLLDRDVAGGVHLRARNHPRRPVLVPDPDVLHLQVEERIARLRVRLEIEPVAQVRRVLREHAVAKQREDRRVLLLQLKLELSLE